MTYTDYSLIFKALGDETRLKILEMVSKEELCACKILEKFSITQPTLSHHMRILCDVELINCRKEGIWNFYSINKNKTNEVIDFLNKYNLNFQLGIQSCQ